MYRNEHFSIELIKTGINFLSYAKLRPNIYKNNLDPFRCFLLYCIKQVKPGMWLPLNRNYDVLGLIKGDWSEYKSSLYKHMLIPTENINFDLLWDNDTNQKDRNNFYVFSDYTFPSYYYGKKTQESMKNWQRYEIIIQNSFFGIKKGQNFEWAWGYKEKMYGYLQLYNENLKRFKNY